MAPIDQNSLAGPLLELGQRALMSGDASAAVTHLKKEVERDGGSTIDAHLLLAEALWQESGSNGTELALPHYEAAAKLARESGDTSKEGMVALGHGFALVQLGRVDKAREQLGHAQQLAAADGNVEAAAFAQKLIDQAAAPAPAGPEATQETWLQFAEAIASAKPVVLFLRGSLEQPADAASRSAVARLRAAGCSTPEHLDVLASASVPAGLASVATSPHLAFPQLFLAGRAVGDAWESLPVDALRERLEVAGASLGEMRALEECEAEVAPSAEPCHGSHFAEGLEPWETALVELVATDGDGAWSKKARQLAAKGFAGEDGDTELDPEEIEAAWQRLKPLVKEKLKSQPDMPCGHSCNTCPTKHDCQLHDAVDVDMEDLVKKVSGA